MGPRGTLTSHGRVEASGRSKAAADASLRHTRIHDDSHSHRLAQSLNARAFTAGNHIYFNRGEYNPSSLEGRRLLAHELTHVAQQRAGAFAGRPQKIRRKVLIQESTPAGPRWREMTRRERRRFVRRQFQRRDRSSARRIVEDMARAGDDFRFDDEAELRTETLKRLTTSRLMQESQRGSRGRRGFGYPFTGPSLYWGPRVNYAARDYWTPKVVDNYDRRRDRARRREIRQKPRRLRYQVYGDPAPHYSWRLTPPGKADPHDAIVKLFVRQPPHKRTLIHCDYLVSLVHFRSFAAAVGKAEFNRRLTTYGLDKIVLRWNAFRDLRLTFPGPLGVTRTGLGSLQRVRPSSPRDLVIGDHVYFWNHEAYDLINERIGNAWRLENAVLVTRRGGRDIFLGHGSGRKTVSQMKRKLAQEFNQVVGRALRLVRQTRSRRASRRHRAFAELAHRFPRVKRLGGAWRIHGPRFGRSINVPLRRIRPREVMGLKDPWDPSKTMMYWVRRPAESR